MRKAPVPTTRKHSERTTVANPRDMRLMDGVWRYNPDKPPGGGPAFKPTGVCRVGKVSDTNPSARNNPGLPKDRGGPAYRPVGISRVGKVRTVNPSARNNPM
jgi:hypothetical protein